MKHSEGNRTKLGEKGDRPYKSLVISEIDESSKVKCNRISKLSRIVVLYT